MAHPVKDEEQAAEGRLGDASGAAWFLRLSRGPSARAWTKAARRCLGRDWV